MAGRLGFDSKPSVFLYLKNNYKVVKDKAKFVFKKCFCYYEPDMIGRTIFRILYIFLFSLLMLTIFACSAPYGVYHRVRRGETLYRISVRYKVNLDELKEANNIRDPKNIKVGAYVFIPGRSIPEEKTVLESKNDKNSSDTRKRPRYVKQKKKNRASAEKGTGSSSRREINCPIKFKWPANGVVTSPFGVRWGVMHEGIDIGLPQGRPVLASASGKVIFAGTHGGYGKTIIVQHEKKFFTIYAHNAKLLARQGQSVRQGERIALSGKTGKATGPHLHFEVRKNSKPLDPLKFLPKKVP